MPDETVAWAYGPTAAHVMRFQGGGEPYRSICGYRVLRPWQEIRWAPHDERLVPWCSWCVSKVRAMALAVLDD